MIYLLLPIQIVQTREHKLLQYHCAIKSPINNKNTACVRKNKLLIDLDTILCVTDLAYTHCVLIQVVSHASKKSICEGSRNGVAHIIYKSKREYKDTTDTSMEDLTRLTGTCSCQKWTCRLSMTLERWRRMLTEVL